MYKPTATLIRSRWESALVLKGKESINMTILRKIDIKNLQVSAFTNHMSNYRNKRISKVKTVGIGNPVAAFVVDKNHPNGNEVHILTDTGLIVILNERTKNLVTILIARPNQIKRYFQESELADLSEILELAQIHKKMKLNS